MAESDKEAVEVLECGPASLFLQENGFEHELLAKDPEGVDVIKVNRDVLLPVATALFAYGFNYLRCQCAYDLGAGQDLVSVYDLVKVSSDADNPEKIRLKVFLPREDPRVPSVYWIWKSADWQERESYDLLGVVYEGHPNLKRILMPEDWLGWPLRKDYITPDFYELQDAY